MALFRKLGVGASVIIMAGLAACSSAGQQAAPVAEPMPAAPPATASSTLAPATPAATPATTPPPATPTRPASPQGTPGATKSAAPTASSSAPAVSSGPVEQPAPGAKVDCSKLKCIALTFDDGPGKDTPRLLEMLTKEKAVATFFQQGVNVRANPAIAKQVANTPGMELGNHSMTHANLAGASRSKLSQEIGGTSQLLKQTTGREVTVFRPPYGSHNAAVDSAAAAAGSSVILWDVDTMDWKSRNANAVRDVVRRQAKPGSIVLMHDIHSSTVNAVPGILTDLKAQGYTLVTVSQLLGGTTPGKVYIAKG